MALNNDNNTNINLSDKNSTANDDASNNRDSVKESGWHAVILEIFVVMFN